MKQRSEFSVSGFWSGLPAAVRAALLCCFGAGMIVHLFAFTNIIPNSDGISRVYDAQQMTISGRWFLHYATAWNGYIQAPALIGFLSVLFLSVSAGLTASLLRLRSAVLGGLTGALMAAFPSVAYTFLYLFTASAYCFGILLAVLAVWLSYRYRFGFLAAVPLLACAIGTYQAYVAVAASLCLIRAALYALEGQRSAREIFLTALKQLVFLVLSLLLYYVVLRIFLKVKDLSMLHYKGIDSFGEDLTPRGLAQLVLSAYKEFLRYFFVPNSFAKYTTVAAVLCNGAMALVGLWSLVRLVRRSGCLDRPLAFALTTLLFLLLPLALNLTVLMGNAMPIMRYALVFTYVLALALADRAVLPPPETASPEQPPDAPAEPLTEDAPTEELTEEALAPTEVLTEDTLAPTEALTEEALAPMEALTEDAPTEELTEDAPTEALTEASEACAEAPEPEAAPAARRPLLRIAAACIALLLCLLSFQTDNLAYTVAATAHRATESFATRLVARVESTPGYEKGMEVIIIGGFPRSVYYSQIQAFELVTDYSNLSSSVIPLNKHIYYYLNDWLNVPWKEPEEGTMVMVARSDEFKNMPIYPSDGSILISGNRVIVRLAETYTPKRDYEIAYEDRR